MAKKRVIQKAKRTLKTPKKSAQHKKTRAKKKTLLTQHKPKQQQKKKQIKTKTKALQHTSRKTKKPKHARASTKKEQFVSTGIKRLDTAIGGGLIPGSITVIEGSSGSAKSILATQVLMEGIKEGEATLYVTFEEKKEAFFKNMKKLGWDLAAAEKNNKFLFLEYSPEKIKMMIDEGGGSIESMVLKYKIKRMVIDSISSFALLFDTDLEKRSALLSLFDIIKKWQCTTLLTVQHDPMDPDNEDLMHLESEVDGIIGLYFIKIKNERKRYLEIVKMRGTKHPTTMFAFEMKQGIKITGIKKGTR